MLLYGRAESGRKQSWGAIPTRGRVFLPALLCLWSCCTFLCHAAQTADTIQRIQDLLRQGDSAAAQALLSQALKQSPADGALYDAQGVIKAQQGAFASAEANFRKAIALAPNLEDTYLNLGRLYQEQFGKDPSTHDKALAIYTALLRFAPDNLEANYQSAVLLMQKGLYAASLRRLARLPGEARARPQALSVRCGDYAGLSVGDKAANVADQMLRGVDLAEADVTSILPILASRRNTPVMLKLLRGLDSRHLASIDSLRTLATLYKAAGRLQEARNTLEAVAQLEPKSVPTLLELARVANDQNDNTGALGYLAHARELEPNNASVHFFWGMVCVEQNLLEEAYTSLKKAAALDPRNAYFNYAMGIVAMQRVNAGESIAYLQKYCELKPHDLHGRLALGAAYFNSHEEEQAEKLLLTVAHDPETSAVANFYLARIAHHRDNLSQALEHINLALRARPNYAGAYAERGIIYLTQREYSQAEEALREALKLDPDNYMGNLNLLILYKRTKNPKVEDQETRFEQLKEEKNQEAEEFMRTIEVRP